MAATLRPAFGLLGGQRGAAAFLVAAYGCGCTPDGGYLDSSCHTPDLRESRSFDPLAQFRSRSSHSLSLSYSFCLSFSSPPTLNVRTGRVAPSRPNHHVRRRFWSTIAASYDGARGFAAALDFSVGALATSATHPPHLWIVNWNSRVGKYPTRRPLPEAGCAIVPPPSPPKKKVSHPRTIPGVFPLYSDRMSSISYFSISRN